MKFLATAIVAFSLLQLTSANGKEASTDFLVEVAPLAEAWRVKHKVPGVGIAIGHGGKIVYAAGIGTSDLENAVAATEDTVFRTASIAKPVTAVAVMQLVDQGKLSLNDPIQKHCPEYPKKEYELTIRDLLCHQGGVRHYNRTGESSGKGHYSTIADSLELFKDDPLLFEPGTQFSYTTYGYSLLGRAVETASGLSFRQYLHDQIFEPAGMETAGIDDTFRIIPNRTRGYHRVTTSSYFNLAPADRKSVKVGQVLNCQLHDTSMKVPGGGLICSPTDLVKFGQAMLADKLVNKETKQLAWKVQTTSDGKKNTYGLGWGIGDNDGIHTVGHSGGQAGTSTMLTILPDQDLVVAVMCNLQGAPSRMLAFQIATALVD